MYCPRCKSLEQTKDVIVRGLQRCKFSGFRFTVSKKSDVKSAETRSLALEMYLEGIGFRAIARVLKISYGTVYQWVKEWGSRAALPQNSDPVAVVNPALIFRYFFQAAYFIDLCLKYFFILSALFSNISMWFWMFSCNFSFVLGGGFIGYISC